MRKMRNPNASGVLVATFGFLIPFVIRHSSFIISLAPLFVREVHKHAPILGRHRMFAFADVIAEAAVHQLAHRWHFLRRQALYPEAAIYWLVCPDHFNLA